MTLTKAREILKAAGAEEDRNAYHFPWTSRFVEVKEPMEGETPEEYSARIGSELRNLPRMNGYSVFFTLRDKTRLELQLEVEGDSKAIYRIRIGEKAKEYKDKFEWSSAVDEKTVREVEVLDPTR